MVSASDFAASPFNEPILPYTPGSEERTKLDAAVREMAGKVHDVPIVIGGKEHFTADVRHQVYPSDHGKKLAKFSYADSKLIKEAIENGLSVRENWERRPLKERADVMFKAADLVAGKYRMQINAATMLGQAKTIIQAEIDAACELIDFLRFNAHSALQLEAYKPISTAQYTDRMIYRGLEGFIAAVSPFNFTAIGGNLASCPALMGNVVVWKPSDTAMLSNYIAYQVLTEAGVPPGVINFVPADGPVFGDAVTKHPSLAAINFTGSVPTFEKLWKLVGQNIECYISFPRLVGECGGKNFHFVHPSADLETVAPCTVRSAFEYQGQKCSAVGRMYVPQSKWGPLREKLLNLTKELKLGPPDQGATFLSAVIDDKAFGRIKGYVEHAKTSKDTQVLQGGTCDNFKGYFVEPTIIETSNPQDKLMTEEIFGPVLTVFPYPDAQADAVLASLKDATPFGLTGAVFAQDPAFLERAQTQLRDAVGNLYINDKSTGSVVGQQPFGGARKSGTNDKAGGPHYCLKWASPQTIKETHVPMKEVKYPYMG